MKVILLFAFGWFTVVCMAQSPEQETKAIDALERQTRQQKKVILRIERVDTTGESGHRLEMTRTYYLDADKKNLLLVTAYENQQSPTKGLQVLYTFSNNRLVKVSAMPAKALCRQCSATYYFANDTLFYKREQNFAVQKAFLLLDDSKRLSARVLPLLNTPQ